MATHTVCGDSSVAGVSNTDGWGGEKCMEPTTHTLRGKGLCEKHWKEGLRARDRDAQRARSYSAQIGRYNR